MGLLLLCGIRCALFVCFVSVREAGPSQNVGSVSGSATISSSYDTQSIWLSDTGIVCVKVCSGRCVDVCLLVSL